MLTDYTPTDTEKKILEGTRWHHKLDKTAPIIQRSFKSFFTEEVIPTGKLSRRQIAEHMLHCIEEEFEVHFSDRIDEKKLVLIKDYAKKKLPAYSGDDSDKAAIVDRVERCTSIREALIRLNNLAHA